MTLFYFSRNISAVFSKSIKAGNFYCKIIVELRELLENDGVELNLEYSFLACKLCCMILGGEGYVNVELFASVMTYNTLFKAGNELTGTESKLVSAVLTAVKCNAVNKAFVVDNCDVTHCCCTVGNFGLTSISASYGLDLAVNLFVGYGSENCLNLDACIICQLDLGLNGHNCGHNNFVFDRNDIKFRAGNDSLAGSVDDLFPVSVDKLVDSILKEDAGTVHLFDYRAGSLAASEAGNVEGVSLLAKNLSLFCFDCSCVKRELDNCLRFFVDFCFSDSHFYIPFEMNTFLYILLIFHYMSSDLIKISNMTIKYLHLF